MIILLIDLLKVFRRLVSQQRAPFACAITAAVLLIGLFRAPIIPVIGGCAGALVLLITRAYRKRENVSQILL